MPTQEELTARDAGFAERLARKDRAVLGEIDRAYARPLQDLLRRFLGRALNDHDVDDILSQTLDETWKGFRIDLGASVRRFYFNVGKRRLQDRLRHNLRRLQAAQKHHPALLRAKVTIEPPSDHAAIEREYGQVQPRIMGMIKEALSKLTSRQQTAFRRRFACADGEHWAKRLAAETKISAKQWRKASDEARLHVRNYLIQHGVRFSREGGRYEVA
jgi:hypothetical protein